MLGQVMQITGDSGGTLASATTFTRSRPFTAPEIFWARRLKYPRFRGP